MGRTTSTVLADRVIWVTRPRQQSETLSRLIETAGGKVIRLPVIEIQPVRQNRDVQVLAAILAAADLVIFVSRNAVKYAATVLPEFYNRIPDKLILAVGAGTRLALEQQGIINVICPEAGKGSEALLQLPQLQPAAVAGKHILIVRGVGGRDLLEQSLREIGVDVNYLEVYQRGIPGIDAGSVAQLWHTDPPDAIIVTSVEGLHNLVNMTPADRRASLFHTPLAVMSDRIGTAARTLGFIYAPAVATVASDAGLVQAIMSKFED